MLICTFSAAAQHPLSRGRRTSQYDYLYQLTDKEAVEIVKDGQKKISSACLHTLRDSVLHDSPLPANLPAGNYLRVFAKDDRLYTAFTAVNNVAVKFGMNGRDLIVILHDQHGALIKDAEARIGKSKLSYDAQTQTWRKDKYNKEELLQISYKGVLNCIPLTRGNNGYSGRKHQTIIQRLKYKILRKRSRHNLLKDYTYRYGSYIVFSKPVYKPGDTVKVKAF
ncbi:hypothetical protein [Chitinophaga pinensis]|uniref:Uncharacterized protein n=1 Tax=Chitinophaga pinensis TaxID=79329 RepID=A0A5C6LRM0_9BACT|nr:hypothetical protein [Chitinophaga pinensis]TWV97357.1 hypothetical protein FEF09_22105 [Chitinophaga pinensis]